MWFLFKRKEEPIAIITDNDLFYGEMGRITHLNEVGDAILELDGNPTKGLPAGMPVQLLPGSFEVLDQDF